MFGGIILLVGRRHFLCDVEGATGQGASLVSASDSPLHLVQQVAAAFVETRKKKGLGVGIQIYESQTSFIV